VCFCCPSVLRRCVLRIAQVLLLTYCTCNDSNSTSLISSSPSLISCLRHALPKLCAIHPVVLRACEAEAPRTPPSEKEVLKGQENTDVCRPKVLDQDRVQCIQHSPWYKGLNDHSAPSDPHHRRQLQFPTPVSIHY